MIEAALAILGTATRIATEFTRAKTTESFVFMEKSKYTVHLYIIRQFDGMKSPFKHFFRDDIFARIKTDI
ncbi:glyoxalase/bleomycin resistance protein/dioxygenase [Aphanothece sacrum FPU1]|uniref:Glyoxalase/bleomycin resistance protein/dioxygenase n=1 Tax=Aphanothece sacrum FPU1 TaxID=1920663 RepID=A0A401IIT9_APHSA|nr:glyoxalase/bleomycin resistance protein/dioxygenase [Aphanothece sacrum FPU1]